MKECHEPFRPAPITPNCVPRVPRGSVFAWAPGVPGEALGGFAGGPRGHSPREHNVMKTAGSARFFVSLISMVGLTSALFVADAPALEVKKFVITDFTAECGGDDVSSLNNMVDGWYDEMDDEGHLKDGSYVNGNMTLQRFCDPDWNGSCDDDAYTDEADAWILGTHGADEGDHWQFVMRYSWNGHCRVDTGGTSDDMWMGDVDAEFVAVASCHSGDDDNLPGLREAMYDPNDSPGNGRRAHQMNVYHGVAWSSDGRRGDYEDFADEAHSDSISDAWVYNQKDSKQCPVAYAISTSLSACLTRLNYERYNYVYSDPPGSTYYCWKAYLGCDPTGETGFAP